MCGTIIRMTCDTRHFYQMGAHGRLTVRPLQLHVLRGHSHIWAAGTSHAAVACDGVDSLKERIATMMMGHLQDTRSQSNMRASEKQERRVQTLRVENTQNTSHWSPSRF